MISIRLRNRMTLGLVLIVFPHISLAEISGVILVENHSDVLVHWINTGVRSAVVVNVDAHDDCAPLPQKNINRLKGFLKDDNIAAIERANTPADSGLYSIGDYIYVACKLKIAREAVWIGPGLKAPSLVREHIKFSTGTVDSLPAFGDAPVFLTVDADVVPPYAAKRCINPVEAIRQITETLRSVSWNVVHASVCYSVDGGFLPLPLRWVGNALHEALQGKNPARADSPWLLLAQVEDWRRGIPPGEMVKKLKPVVNQRPKDPWLHVYLADALFKSDDVSGALKEGKKAAALDSGCCRILPEIGRQLADAGKWKEAKRFLAAAPSMVNVPAEFAVAQALERVGRTKEAIEHLKRIRNRLANYSIELLIGYGYERLGDTTKARMHYLRVIDLLNAPVAEMPAFTHLGPSLTAAERLLRTTGYTKQAEVLRRDSRCVSFFDTEE